MSIELIQAKQRRGKILRLLGTWFGQSLMASTIVRALGAYGMSVTDAEVGRDFYYLRDKGYVTLAQADDEGKPIILIALTSKGLDLLEKNIPDDPGVEAD